MNRFAIALVDDKSDMILGYVSGYRKGGYYQTYLPPFFKNI